MYWHQHLFHQKDFWVLRISGSWYKILIFSPKPEFIYWHELCLIFLETIGSFHSVFFLKNLLSSHCHFIFKWPLVGGKIPTTNSLTTQLQRVNHHISVDSRSVLCLLPFVAHRDYLKKCIAGLKFSQGNILLESFLKEMTFLYYKSAEY